MSFHANALQRLLESCRTREAHSFPLPVDVVADWLKSQRTMSAAKNPPFTKDSKVAIIGAGVLFSQQVMLQRRQSTADLLSQPMCLLCDPFTTA
jgi:hypothetical protein